MTFLGKKLCSSPVLIRVVPFVLFVVLTYLQEQFGQDARYWFYVGKTLLGGWMVWEMRDAVREMRWAFSWEAVVVGVSVFVAWVGLDGFYPPMGKAGVPWNPFVQFGSGALSWCLIVARVIGMTFIVPPLEEVFFRSFLYRYAVKKDFLSVPLNFFHPLAFGAAVVLFALEHQQWLPGIISGIGYQLLVLKKNRLGDAISAHAITNLLLALWVVWKSAWNFF
jgi:CAAX prenyl protease-like protein